MAAIFTEHVRRLGDSGARVAAAPPELALLLRRRLAEEGFLAAPPDVLGCHAAHWDDAAGWSGFVAACHAFAVLDRLEGLRRQLRARGDVEDLVARNVDHFLIERRRRFDPVGYGVAGNVAGAVRLA